MRKKNKKWFSKTSWARFTQYYVWVIPAFGILGVLFIFPGILALRYSFTNYVLTRPESLRFVGLKNYIRLFQMDLVQGALGITFYISSIAITILVIGALGLALLLHQKEIKHKSLFRTILLIPMLTPPVVMALQFKWMFVATFGVINHVLMGLGIIQNEIPWLYDPYWARWAVIINVVMINLPFLTFLFLAGLESLPEEPFQAAKIDGASVWQSFRYLTIPMVFPVLTFGTALIFLLLIQSYGPIRVLTEGGPGNATQVLSMIIFELSFLKFLLGMGSALSMITIGLLLPLIVFFVKRTS